MYHKQDKHIHLFLTVHRVIVLRILQQTIQLFIIVRCCVCCVFCSTIKFVYNLTHRSKSMKFLYLSLKNYHSQVTKPSKGSIKRLLSRK